MDSLTENSSRPPGVKEEPPESDLGPSEARLKQEPEEGEIKEEDLSEELMISCQFCHERVVNKGH